MPELRRIGSALAALILVAGAALGQPDEGEETSAEAAEPRVEAIPISRIAPRSEAALLELGELREQADIAAAVDELREELAELGAETDAALAGFESTDLGTTARRDLAVLGDAWAARSEALADWQGRLGELAEQAIEARQRLRALDRIWRATAASLDPDDIPASIQERIDTIQTEIADIRSGLPAQIETVLEIQDAVSDRVLAVRAVRDRIADEQAASLRDLLRRSHVPIWETFSAGRPTEVVGESRRSLSGAWEMVVEWARRDRNVLIAQVALFLILFFLFYVVRRRAGITAEEAASDEALWTADHLLSRSAAAPLLVTLLASRWLHTDRPEPATNLLLLLAIPPVLSLTRGLVPKQARTPILLVIGLLILKIFGGALTSGTLAGRWLLLLGSAVGLTTIGWFIRVRRGRPRQRLGGIGFWRVLGVFLPVAGALFATAIVADVLGFAALGGYLASGTVLSLWMAVVFYLGALVLSSLFVFISHRDPVRSLRVVQGRGAGLERFAGRLFHLAAILMWARATLFAFDLWGPVTDRLVGLTTQEWEVGAVTISASDILSLLGIFLGSLILARLVRILLDEEIFPRMTLPRGVPGALSMLSRYFIVAFGILLGLSAAGIDLSSFGLAAGALGLGLGFGLQDVIGNFVSGLILAVERPIQKGDTVEVGNLLGRVSEIGVRSSKVQTFEGAEVIVPNGSLLSKELINWTLSDERRRLDIAVRVAYGTDPHHVVELLEGVAAVHPEVLQDPPPRALFDGFGDTSLDFRLQCWVPFGKGVVAKSDLALGIHDALKEAGISIPVPRRRIVSSEDP